MTTQQLCINAARRALDRAYAEGVHERFAFVESDDDGCLEAYYVNSGGHGYFVTDHSCSCPAGSHRPIMLCKHILAAADKAGLLDRYIPGCYERGFAVAPQLAA